MSRSYHRINIIYGITVLADKNLPCFTGIPIVQLVAGPRVATSTDEGFAVALTDSGDVYSWGKGYKGRLGHSMQCYRNMSVPSLLS